MNYVMRSRHFLSFYKVFFALLGFSAVVTEIAVLAERGIFNPVNFFSFFTIQTNIIVSATFMLSAYTTAGKKQYGWLHSLRVAATVYILIVGIGFVVLLSGVEGLVLSAVPWDNIVLHYIIPVATLLDFIVDRPSLKNGFHYHLMWLLFPVMYGCYSMIRGAVTNWYPYPFLDPGLNGYAGVAVSMSGLILLGLSLTWVTTKLARKT